MHVWVSLHHENKLLHGREKLRCCKCKLVSVSRGSTQATLKVYLEPLAQIAKRLATGKHTNCFESVSIGTA